MPQPTDPEIMAEFQRRKTRVTWVVIGGLVTGLMLAFKGLVNPPLALLGILILFALPFYAFRHFRCPACNAYIGRSLSLVSCPKCKVKLQEYGVGKDKQHCPQCGAFTGGKSLLAVVAAAIPHTCSECGLLGCSACAHWHTPDGKPVRASTVTDEEAPFGGGRRLTYYDVPWFHDECCPH